MINSTIKSLFIALATLSTASAFAEDYSITLTGNANEAVKVGVLTTKATEQAVEPKTESSGDNKSGTKKDVAKHGVRGVDYKIKWETAQFEDHFLSMRPFKCLSGGGKLWCHTPYPYEIKRHLSDDDVTDLEYDLIFVWKPEGKYGIDLWNGVYYQLTPTEFGWKGVMKEYDLNILGIPPKAGELRPILEKDLNEASTEDHFLPFVEIRKIQSPLNQ